MTTPQMYLSKMHNRQDSSLRARVVRQSSIRRTGSGRNRTPRRGQGLFEFLGACERLRDQPLRRIGADLTYFGELAAQLGALLDLHQRGAELELDTGELGVDQSGPCQAVADVADVARDRLAGRRTERAAAFGAGQRERPLAYLVLFSHAMLRPVRNSSAFSPGTPLWRAGLRTTAG